MTNSDWAITAGHNDNSSILIDKNTFIGPPAETTANEYASYGTALIENWASYSGQTLITNNTFIDFDSSSKLIGTAAGYDSSDIFGSGNIILNGSSTSFEDYIIDGHSDLNYEAISDYNQLFSNVSIEEVNLGPISINATWLDGTKASWHNIYNPELIDIQGTSIVMNLTSKS